MKSSVMSGKMNSRRSRSKPRVMMLGDIIACAVKFTGFDRHLIIVEYGNRY